MWYGSVCSGIGVCRLAWQGLGLKPRWFAEVDPQARSVLSHHWPEVTNLGDITAASFVEQARQKGKIDVLVGGTPCQGFSLAGEKKGLQDRRSSLVLRFLELVEQLGVRYFVWENVRGVLSIDGGRAFGSLCGQMARRGWGWVYRVLDSQDFGLPHRRRRVYLIGDTSGRCPRPVLFERTIPKNTLAKDPRPVTRSPVDPVSPGQAGKSSVEKAAFHLQFTKLTTIVRRTNVVPPLLASKPRGRVCSTGVAVIVETHIPGSTARCLTPTECERLQGLPDDHTLIPHQGELLTDGPRYRMIGLAMSVPVMRWVGKGLVEYHRKDTIG